MDADDLRNLKLIAMNGVVNGNSEDYTIRYIFRWYSKNFSTPLHIVETLPFEDVLLNYFESKYEELDEEEIEAQVKDLLLSKEERLKLQRSEDAMDADTWEFGKEAVVTPPPVAPVDPMMANLGLVTDAASKLTEVVKALEPIPEGIHMTFDDLEEDAQGFGPPPKPIK